jgi:hypothetical protein
VIEHATHLLSDYLPEGDREITTIIESAIARLGHVGALSLGNFVVTGRRILGVLTTSLNHVSEVNEHDDRLPRRIVVELALMTGLSPWLRLRAGTGVEGDTRVSGRGPTRWL